ncbi:hypothetical protein JOQ06_023633 [Pogonophryne albipinna]|uniref:Uncharacterized protein n=1 Tax=Pogonophryne albipinna TaxID=1090488 RepID=A0AAD6BJJ0_9TELE|nr:hypothetical protein JOQ06_023633 [Pogonophryne albipinna]
MARQGNGKEKELRLEEEEERRRKGSREGVMCGEEEEEEGEQGGDGGSALQHEEAHVIKLSPCRPLTPSILSCTVQ